MHKLTIATALLVFGLLAGLWSPAEPQVVDAAQLIVDGGFENGGIPNTVWNPETSTNFGTPLCDVPSCGTGGGASPPRTGAFWAWFGGIPAAETATLGQTVFIPVGQATLTFWMRIGTVSSPYTDVLNVRVDGVILQSFPEPTVAEGAYSLRTIILNSFANGASHNILFEYIGTSSGSGSYVIDDVEINTPVTPTTFRADFNADGRADFAVWRPSNGTWYVKDSLSGTELATRQWGLATDIPVAGDFNADNRADFAVFRPSTGTWFVLDFVSAAVTTVQWGLAGDIPFAADFNADGRADFAVWRPSTGYWYVRDSITPTVLTVRQWGLSTDIPLVGNYNLDNRADFAVWRPSSGTFFVLDSFTGGLLSQTQWGLNGDKPFLTDFSADGQADFAVWRPSSGTWFVRDSVTTATLFITQWGISTDTPMPGDFSGDGRADLAVWRSFNGTWYVRDSATGVLISQTQFGLPGDIPQRAPTQPQQQVAPTQPQVAGAPTQGDQSPERLKNVRRLR